MKLGWGIKGKILSLCGIVFVMQIFTSCGQDYEKPSTTTTPNSLISAETLKQWMDEGLVNKANGISYDRVVILDLTTFDTYTTGHIPGALFVNSVDIGQNRNEGVATSSYEVLDGYKMDDLVQKYGIDGKTTIVFTSGTPGTGMNNAAKAYFTFRYWGFPKNRLKLLDGLNTTWNASYGLAPGLPPAVNRSSYSVTNNGVLRDDLRVSLAEMIDYADGKVPNVIAIDVRGSGATSSYMGFPGATPGGFDPPTGDKVVFEGRIRGAKAIAGGSLYSSNVFKSTDELITAFTSTSVGLDSTKTAYVYCVKGFASATTFFILDGILGWPVALYDGSWQQWGQLSDNTAMKGQLAAGSRWSTDGTTGRSDLVVYNWANSKPVEQLTVDGSACSATYNVDGTYLNSSGTNTLCPAADAPTSFDTDVNQIEEADKAYMNAGGTGGSTGGTSVPAGC